MDVKCPSCGKLISLSETEYESLLSQIRTKEFEASVDKRIKELEQQYQIQQDTAIQKAVLDAEKLQLDKQNELNLELVSLKNELSLVKRQAEFDVKEAVAEQKLKDDADLKAVQVELEYYKDLKTRMSTKMVGETLEQHCQIQFNQIRATAFPNAYFEKDNDAKTGSKGDFIYREEQDGIPLLSIMFEMKNGATCSTTSHCGEKVAA